MYYNDYHTAKNCMVPNRAKNITRFRLKHIFLRGPMFTQSGRIQSRFIYIRERGGG